MSSTDIITLVITGVGLLALCIVFTFLFAHYYGNETEKVTTGQKDIYLLDDLLVENKKKHKTIRKVFGWIGKIFSYIVMLVIIFFFGVALVNRINGVTTFVGGQSLIVIATGSMSSKNDANPYLDENNLDNQFNAYDIIGISTYESQDDVKLYDVVAYKANDGRVIVHRIVNFLYDSETSELLGYITRGDANSADDTGSLYTNYLPYSSIIGHYNETRIQGLGMVIYFLQQPAGVMTIVSVVYCFVMYDIFSRKYQHAVYTRSNELATLVDFDLDDEKALDDAEVTFHEAIIYKGKAYYFADNKFVEAGSAPLYEEPVYMRKDPRGHRDIYVKDSLTNDIHHISPQTLKGLEIDDVDEKE